MGFFHRYVFGIVPGLNLCIYFSQKCALAAFVASNRLNTKIKVVTETETVSQVAVYKEVQILHDYTFHTFLETTYMFYILISKSQRKTCILVPVSVFQCHLGTVKH